MKNHEALLKKIDAQKKEWEAQLKHLQAKAENFEADALIEYQRKLDDINDWLKEAEHKAHQLKDATKESLQSLGINIEEAWNELAAKIDNTILKLKK